MVPYAAGGPSDIVTRVVAPVLAAWRAYVYGRLLVHVLERGTPHRLVLAAIPLFITNPFALGLLTLLAIYGILLIGLDVTVVDMDDKEQVVLTYSESSTPPPPEDEDEEQVETLES